MSTTVDAVKMPGQKKFHLLKPGAFIGTLYCGSDSRKSGTSRWCPIDDVVESQRCRTCWSRASRR